MKLNILLGSIAILTSYLTCKNMHKSSDSTTTTAPEQQEEYSSKGFNLKASHVVEGNNPDSAYTYQIKKAPAHVNVPWEQVAAPSTSRRAFMSTNWWAPRFAYQPSDTTIHLNYITKKIKFHEDQSFDLYDKEKLMETGHWAVDEDKKILYLSCKNTYFNNTWRLQENGFRMVLIGNTDLNVTGIQIRMDGTNKPPATE